MREFCIATYSTLRGQIKGAGRDCRSICARVHPLSKHELVSATIKTCTCIGVISGPLVGYKSVTEDCKMLVQLSSKLGVGTEGLSK